MTNEQCLTCGECYHQVTLTRIRSNDIPLCAKCINLLDSMGELAFVKYFKKFLTKYVSRQIIKLDPETWYD